MRFRGLWSAIFALAVLTVGQGQPAALENEPLLQRRITVWLKLEPMRDALRSIGKQTGVSLRCIDAIAEEKVAIFVEDRPAHEILTQLAKLFRYEWRKDESGAYVLYVPDATRLQEEKMRNAVQEARRQALRELIEAARAVRKLSIEQRQAEMRQLRAKYESLSPKEQMQFGILFSMTPYQFASTEEDSMSTQQGYEFPPDYAFLCCLAALPDRAVEALLKGQVIGFSTKPAPGVFLLPNDALLPSWMRDRRWIENPKGDEYVYLEQAAPSNPEFSGLWMRMCSRLSALEYQLVSCQTIGITQYTNLSLGTSDSAYTLSLVSHLESAELWRFWEAWASAEERLTEFFAGKGTPPRDRPAPPVPIYRGTDSDVQSDRVTVADMLEQIAWATRVPVISDAFRTLAVPSMYAQQPNRPEALRSLQQSCWLRADESGYLLARHKYYWSYRAYELPEAWLRPLEQKYEQQGWLGLDDYIALAGKLTQTQVEYLTQSRHFPYTSLCLTRFEFEPLVACLPALRFLATLNAAQRQQLNQGQWLPARLLNTTQRQRFNEAVGELFPPPQALFREPIPDAAKRFVDSRNLIRGMWTDDTPELRDDESPPAPPDAPQGAAVRLFEETEHEALCVRASQGYISHIWYTTDVQNDILDKDIQRLLEQDPGSRLLSVRLRRQQIMFLDNQGREHSYQFVLSRYTPYTPSSKPEQQQESPPSR
ncbi:MAG: hypothetical protein ACK4ME_08290 [Fimbriimonadales bacterium]